MKLVIDFILVGGIMAVLLILVQLCISKERQLPHLYLIAIFSFVLIIIINFYSILHNIKIIDYLSSVLEDGSRFLIGPLIFLYIKSLFEKKQGFVLKNTIHFLPYIVYLALFSIPIFLHSFLEEYQFSHLEILDTTRNLTLLKDFYFLSYILISFKLFHFYRNKIKTIYSTFATNNFGWIKQMLTAALIIISIDVLTDLYELIFGKINWEIGFVTTVSMIFFIFYLGYYGIKQSTIFLPDFLINNTIPTDKKVNLPTEFNDSELKKLKLKLEAVFINNKPYLDSNLNLNRLAQQMELTDKKLSIFLNQSMNISFFDLVNKYRIEAVKDKLKSNTDIKYSLWGIASECGFSSKSSFYRIFKNETALSPAEYKKTILK